MAEIVVVHGILNEFLGPASVEASWRPAIMDGLRLAGYSREPSVSSAFYGDLFRQPGTKGVGPPLLVSDDMSHTERALLFQWWETAAALEPESVQSPVAESKVSWPASVQRAIRALLKSSYFRGLAGDYGERALLFALRQVRTYLEDEDLRRSAQARLCQCLTEETRVIVAHSLGSVVAYEALCSRSQSSIRALVTLGSPLGIRPLIFDRLRPAPQDGFGCWPNVSEWWNIADEGDVVALTKSLDPLFTKTGRIHDVRVYNGWRSHDVTRYLSARQTGEAIGSVL